MRNEEPHGRYVGFDCGTTNYSMADKLDTSKSKKNKDKAELQNLVSVPPIWLVEAR